MPKKITHWENQNCNISRSTNRITLRSPKAYKTVSYTSIAISHLSSIHPNTLNKNMYC